MSNLNDQLAAELERARAAGLYRSLRHIASAQGPRIVLDGREFLNFSSNDYLGLANDPLLKRAAVAAVKRYGVGAGASRLVCGNLAPYDELEQRLARFKGKEAAIVFGSGYTANVGTITALVGEGDVVILDKLDHASIIDGARQSGATIRVYPHKDMRKLEEILRQSVGAVSPVGAVSNRDRACPEPVGAVFNRDQSGLKSPPTRSHSPRILIITETVFSMDGDVAPLAEIVELKDRYGAWLMIDEAHATGLFGKHRRGLAEALGVEKRVDITLGTLSKALGCAGGFVVGSQTLIDYLRNRARSLIYSTALPPAVCAAASAAVDFVMSAEGHKRRDQLWRNVRQMHDGFSVLGIQSPPAGGNSAIIPLIVGGETAAMEMSQRLFERGIFVPAIRFPTVPKGKARLRVTVTAGHTAKDIGEFLTALGSVGAVSPVGAVSNRDPLRSIFSVGAVSNRDRVLAPAAELSRMKSAPTTAPAEERTESAPTTTKRQSPHSSDLRKSRVSIPDECYFVTTCTEGRQPILQNAEAAQVVIESLRWLRDAGRIRLLGFVVMPDHVHVALVLREGWTLGEVMQSFKRHTSQRIHLVVGAVSPVGAVFNRDAQPSSGSSVGAVSNRDSEQTPIADTIRSHKNKDALWQSGYHDHLMRDRHDFEQRLAYMHDNPVRKGLVKAAHEYPFSTAHPDYQNEIDWAWLEGAPKEDRG